MQRINLDKNTNIFIVDYESLFNKSVIISYNENYIEIPGVVIFSRKKEKQSLFDRILNPGIEIVSIEEEMFEQMIESIKVHEAESYVISFDSKTKPSKTILINIEALKEAFVFAKVDNDTITINDYVFTNNEMEFHGDGMFTSRKVYFIDFDSMSKIKAILEK